MFLDNKQNLEVNRKDAAGVNQGENLREIEGKN